MTLAALAALAAAAALGAAIASFNFASVTVEGAQVSEEYTLTRTRASAHV